MEQFLKAEEVPRRFGGIGREQRIGQLLERSIPEKRHRHQHDGQNLEDNCLAQNQVGVGHQLRSRLAFDLRRRLPRDEDDAARIFGRIGPETHFVFIRLAHDRLERSARHPSEFSRNAWQSVPRRQAAG